MTSCRKSLLDTAPYNAASSETMWTTDGLTDQGVTGVYQALRLSISTGGASGNELYQFDRLGFVGQGRDMDAMLNGTITANSSIFSTNWQQLYEGVKRANDAIYNIPLKSPSSDVKKSRYIAETKFLRAYFYFRLNQLYKGVPLYLEPISINEATKPRETEAKIWEVVLQDLTDAINEPNLPNKYAAGDALYGHITKGAAYALRGKTYMYLKQWQNAINDFQKVKDAGYKLFTGSYKDLFTLANEKSDEMIFSLQHINLDGYGSTTQFYCGTRSSFGSCWNTYLISPNLVDLYENADGSPFNWDDVIPGYSAMPAAKREVFFFRDNLTTQEITAATNRGLDMSLYLPAGNEARIKAAYTNRDPRLNANVIVPYATYLGRPIDGADRTFTSRWPARLESSPTFDLFTDTRSNFYYLHRKYVYEGSTQLTTRVTGPTDRAAERIARARFAILGASTYPDATFSLRISYGAVKGWTDHGKTTGPFTTWKGLWERATGQPPYDLAPRWVNARDKVNPGTVFNFVSDNDIIGGNSGSPIIDANGAVIGAVFDGNIQSLGGAFGFDGRVNRAVSVATSAITEALEKVYGNTALTAELKGR